MSTTTELTVFMGPHAAALLNFWAKRHHTEIVTWDGVGKGVDRRRQAIGAALSDGKPVIVVCDNHWPSSEELDALLPIRIEAQRRLVATDHIQLGTGSSHRCAAMTAALAERERWSSVYVVCGTWLTRGNPSVIVREGFPVGLLPELTLPGSTSVAIKGSLNPIDSLPAEQGRRLTLSTRLDPKRRSWLRGELSKRYHSVVQWVCAREEGLDRFPADPRLGRYSAMPLAWVSWWDEARPPRSGSR